MRGDENVFIPVTFHVPVAVAVARVSPDYRLLDLVALDAPDFDPRRIVETFWKGVEVYSRAALVDFNGRGFDIPLMTLSAFRFGIDCPRYFNDSRFGFRYRFTEKHIDLMEWLSEYGSFRMKGGLNLLAKMLGKPGKMGTKGDQVAEMFARGEIREINDYCLHDVLDTYFVLLRTRVLTGELSLEREQEIVRETKAWIADRVPRHASAPDLSRRLRRLVAGAVRVVVSPRATPKLESSSTSPRAVVVSFHDALLPEGSPISRARAIRRAPVSRSKTATARGARSRPAARDVGARVFFDRSGADDGEGGPRWTPAPPLSSRPTRPRRRGASFPRETRERRHHRWTRG